MSLPKLYLETTIPSYLTARRSRDLRRIRKSPRHGGKSSVRNMNSSLQPMCVRKQPKEIPALATSRLTLLDGIPVLPTTEEVENLAGKLLVGGLIPAKAATDAFPIAIAAVHHMDFLLTWNSTHIHNLSIIRRVERICASEGYACPVICNPDELLPPSIS